MERDFRYLARQVHWIAMQRVESLLFQQKAIGRQRLNWRQRKAEGCIAVEMELAGVQAVCDCSGLSDANHNMNKLYVAIEIVKRI